MSYSAIRIRSLTSALLDPIPYRIVQAVLFSVQHQSMSQALAQQSSAAMAAQEAAAAARITVRADAARNPDPDKGPESGSRPSPEEVRAALRRLHFEVAVLGEQPSADSSPGQVALDDVQDDAPSVRPEPDEQSRSESPEIAQPEASEPQLSADSAQAGSVSPPPLGFPPPAPAALLAAAPEQPAATDDSLPASPPVALLRDQDTLALAPAVPEPETAAAASVVEETSPVKSADPATAHLPAGGAEPGPPGPDELQPLTEASGGASPAAGAQAQALSLDAPSLDEPPVRGAAPAAAVPPAFAAAAEDVVDELSDREGSDEEAEAGAGAGAREADRPSDAAGAGDGGAGGGDGGSSYGYSSAGDDSEEEA